MRAIARLPWVHLKVSELGLKDRPWSAEENRRVVMEAVEIFGTGRCMWASNFPVAGLRVGYREQVTAMLAMFDGFSAGGGAPCSTTTPRGFTVWTRAEARTRRPGRNRAAVLIKKSRPISAARPLIS